MQAMNLRFDQAVNTSQKTVSDYVHGLDSINQSDYSFKAALEHAQKELSSSDVQKTAKDATDGTKSESTEFSQKNEDYVLKDVIKDENCQDLNQNKIELCDSQLDYLEANPDELLALDFFEDPQGLFEKTFCEEQNFYLFKNEMNDESLLELEHLVELAENNAKNICEKNVLEDVVSFGDIKDFNLEKSSEEDSENAALYSITGSYVSVKTDSASGADPEIGENTKSKSLKTSKSKEKTLITVDDRRSVNLNSKNSEKFVTKIEKLSDNNVQMTMSLTSKLQDNIEFKGINSGSVEGSDMSKFSQMLGQQIQSNSIDFVKAGNLILRDNNKGTINLVLHPEDLGNVKIQLEVSDKLIAGKIVVATKEAYDAFNENMNSLKQAFSESGFDTGNFDLSWSGQDGQNQREEKNLYGTVYQNNIPEVAEEYYDSEYLQNSYVYGSSTLNVIA